jgi:hypothetical protein
MIKSKTQKKENNTSSYNLLLHYVAVVINSEPVNGVDETGEKMLVGG